MKGSSGHAQNNTPFIISKLRKKLDILALALLSFGYPPHFSLPHKKATPETEAALVVQSNTRVSRRLSGNPAAQGLFELILGLQSEVAAPQVALLLRFTQLNRFLGLANAWGNPSPSQHPPRASFPASSRKYHFTNYSILNLYNSPLNLSQLAPIPTSSHSLLSCSPLQSPCCPLQPCSRALQAPFRYLLTVPRRVKSPCLPLQTRPGRFLIASRIVLFPSRLLLIGSRLVVKSS